MKFKIFLLFAFLVFSSTMVSGQAHWTTDFDKSIAVAKAEKKPILLLFTGSDWCPPCKRLHRAIFDSKEFEEYANKNVVLVKADFPRRKQNQLPFELKLRNEKLATKYGIRGFPTVLILDTNGKVLDKKVGYSGISPKGYIENIKKQAETIL